jgi:RND superfamily putative drug exporter
MIRWLSVPIILGWLALTVVVNVVAPQLEEVGAAHPVAMTAKDAPSTIAMMRIGKDFQQFDSDTTAMVLLEGQDKLGDDTGSPRTRITAARSSSGDGLPRARFADTTRPC